MYQPELIKPTNSEINLRQPHGKAYMRLLFKSLIYSFHISDVKMKRYFELQIFNTNTKTSENGGVGQWLKVNVEVRKHLKNAREIIQEITFELMHIFTNENWVWRPTSNSFFENWILSSLTTHDSFPMRLTESWKRLG